MKYLPLYIGMSLLFAAPAGLAAGDAGPAAVSALVQTMVVQERNVVENLDVFGTVEPGPGHLKALVAPRASVVQLLVPDGAQIKRGEPLVSLNATPEASVQYAQAESQAVYARSALEHTRSLFQEHLVTRDQLDAAQKALTDAQANLAALRKMGGKGTDVLRAAADGVVTMENVASGAQVPAGTTLLTIAERGAVYARLGVDAGRVRRVKTGMPVMLNEVFNPAIKYISRVDQVGGAVDPATGLVDVLAPVSERDAANFMPGTHVAGVIEVQASRSLAVPRSAVLRDAQGAYVFIVRDHTAHKVAVKTGIDGGTWIAVRGALHAGERVVIMGNYELTDGMRVRERTL